VMLGLLETLKLSLMFSLSILNRAREIFTYNMKYFFAFLYRQLTVLIAAGVAKGV
jgi:hypothetical protein